MNGGKNISEVVRTDVDICVGEHFNHSVTHTRTVLVVLVLPLELIIRWASVNTTEAETEPEEEQHDDDDDDDNEEEEGLEIKFQALDFGSFALTAAASAASSSTPQKLTGASIRRAQSSYSLAASKERGDSDVLCLY